MFDRILVANRGEIACRVLRTARRLGIRTAAVYSDADAAALHVALADEAYRIGPAPARASSLHAEAILEAAARSGARAIHPGYGFLAENAAFAEACAGAGIVFIGPPPAAIRAMGSKSAAKEIMKGAGVPLVPGYHGENQEPAFLRREAERLGFPVLIKASAGGGGKGMRAVPRADDFDDAIAGADALAIMTEWKHFVHPDFTSMRRLMRRPVIFDGRNLYNPRSMAKAGFTYYSIGRPAVRPE